MNIKSFLVPFLAVLATLMVGLVSAGDLSNNIEVSFNDVVLSSSGMTMAGDVGDVVPVRVTFDGDVSETAEDVRVKVWMEGHRRDVEASTNRFDVVDGSTYTELLSLELPEDLKDVTKEFTLHVSVSNAEGYDSEDFTVRMQRESYDLDVLSIDFNSAVESGDVVPVMVVVKNTGFQRADDNYVLVSIPELGVSSKAYIGDLVPVEDCDDECDDEEDSYAKTIYLKIPEGADGVYEMEVEVYNRDSSTVVRELIRVGGSSSTSILAAVKNQDMKAGETKIYDLIIVNSDDKVKVFQLNAVSGSELEISVPSVVTVDAGSSTTVPVSVKAAKGAGVGSYTFSVDVDGEQVVFGANITGSRVATSVVALTVVLVIIFVVLLVVLIVLLSRKEKPIEEVETSYY